MSTTLSAVQFHFQETTTTAAANENGSGDEKIISTAATTTTTTEGSLAAEEGAIQSPRKISEGDYTLGALLTSSGGASVSRVVTKESLLGNNNNGSEHTTATGPKAFSVPSPLDHNGGELFSFSAPETTFQSAPLNSGSSSSASRCGEQEVDQAFAAEIAKIDFSVPCPLNSFHQVDYSTTNDGKTTPVEEETLYLPPEDSNNNNAVVSAYNSPIPPLFSSSSAPITINDPLISLRSSSPLLYAASFNTPQEENTSWAAVGGATSIVSTGLSVQVPVEVAAVSTAAVVASNSAVVVTPPTTLEEDGSSFSIAKKKKSKAPKKQKSRTKSKQPTATSGVVAPIARHSATTNTTMDRHNMGSAPSPLGTTASTMSISIPHHTYQHQQGAVDEPETPSSSGSPSGNTVSTLNPNTNAVENTGRWTAEEHRLFLQGLEQHGKGWKKIAGLIKSRTVVQIRTHAQKYFQKLAKARAGDGSGIPMIGGGAGEDSPELGPQAAVAASNTMNSSGGGKAGGGLQMLPPANTVTMRTVNQHHHGNHGNMSLGTDSVSMAAAAGQIDIASGVSTSSGGASSRNTTTTSGGLKRRTNAKSAGGGGGTKRRAIGSVVRSAVREGRNVKRQKIAEGRRNGGATAATSGGDGGVPNPLPAISNILDPYVPSVASAAAVAGAKKGRGRQQIVQTATHGSLPMAALEDAV